MLKKYYLAMLDLNGVEPTEGRQLQVNALI